TPPVDGAGVWPRPGLFAGRALLDLPQRVARGIAVDHEDRRELRSGRAYEPQTVLEGLRQRLLVMSDRPSGRFEPQEPEEPRREVVASVRAVECLPVEVERGVSLLRQDPLTHPRLEPLRRRAVSLRPALRKDQVDDVPCVL